MEERKLNNTNYIVREDGVIYNNGKELKQKRNSDGLLYVPLKFNNSKRINWKRVDHVVANAYFNLLHEDGELVHLDYIVDNNHYKNLQWISFESDSAIDALDNSCIIIRVDNNTSYITNFYRGEIHASIKTKQDKTSRDTYSLYKLSNIEIVDVNTAYMVFISKDKMCVARYDQSTMYKLMEVLK